MFFKVVNIIMKTIKKILLNNKYKMTRRIPDVPKVPSVSEAWPMEKYILNSMSSFWEVICSVWEKISSVFKKKSKKLDSSWWKTLETKWKPIKEGKEFDSQWGWDSQFLETHITSIEDIRSILKQWGRLDYQNPKVSKLVKRIIWDAWDNENDYKLLINNLYKIDGVDHDFVDNLLRGIDYLFEKLWSRKCSVVNKSGGSTFDHELELHISYFMTLARFKKYRRKVLAYLKDLNKINREIYQKYYMDTKKDCDLNSK